MIIDWFSCVCVWGRNIKRGAVDVELRTRDRSAEVVWRRRPNEGPLERHVISRTGGGTSESQTDVFTFVPEYMYLGCTAPWILYSIINRPTLKPRTYTQTLLAQTGGSKPCIPAAFILGAESPNPLSWELKIIQTFKFRPYSQPRPAGEILCTIDHTRVLGTRLHFRALIIIVIGGGTRSGVYMFGTRVVGGEVCKLGWGLGLPLCLLFLAISIPLPGRSLCSHLFLTWSDGYRAPMTGQQMPIARHIVFGSCSTMSPYRVWFRMIPHLSALLDLAFSVPGRSSSNNPGQADFFLYYPGEKAFVARGRPSGSTGLAIDEPWNYPIQSKSPSRSRSTKDAIHHLGPTLTSPTLGDLRTVSYALSNPRRESFFKTRPDFARAVPGGSIRTCRKVPSHSSRETKCPGGRGRGDIAFRIQEPTMHLRGERTDWISIAGAGNH
ncbi:hypothetical protein AG1IA_07696 [Rhizoctonia solani AG-1 IA]|uniref:Uncharacterized protein n=1 Tax=Thanatephorus cucumeris (strain AG1-IA) TaxID=983506 RepID=L8WK47_THACA|nr:hypothetical protein AG1IA_07696 [Rhizoctonia solani AG-1 IA]